jgi:hypothetical protein
VSGFFSADGLSSALQLREHLQRGGEPGTQPPSLRLYEDELQYYTSSFRLLAYEDKEVGYTRIRGDFSPGGLMVSAAAAPINALLKGNAKRKAKFKWREVTRGTVFVTNQRLILGVDHRLVDWYHGALASVQLMPIGVYAAYHDADAHVVDVGPAANPWFYVLLSYLGFGNRYAQLPT